MNTQSLFQAIIGQMNLGELLQLRDMINRAIDIPSEVGDIDTEFNNSPPTPTFMMDQKIITLGKEGRRLQAIKDYKDFSGLGLKEAKDYCDALFALNK